MGWTVNGTGPPVRPRRGDRRAWGAVSKEFERRLAEQETPAIAARVDSWVRWGRDYLQIVIVATVNAADAAEALDAAWWFLRKTEDDDAEGWTWQPPVRECGQNSRIMAASLRLRASKETQPRCISVTLNASVYVGSLAGQSLRRLELKRLRHLATAGEPS